MPANLYALGAIALWISLASLGVLLQHLPPFLLTGVALLMGSVLALPFVLQDRQAWRIPATTLALGVCGLFGFHFLLFIALRHAPPVEANLVNYLWPLFMVVLAGAALAILGASSGAAGGGGWSWGFVPALASAFIWASYSLLTQRVKPFPTAAIGLFGLVSGLLSLLCHWALEPQVALGARDWLLLAAMGLGPLGGAFFLWDKALKLGDARQIGILSYLTPLGSTALLMLVSGRPLSWSIGLAAVMIIGAAVLGTRTK